jgi:hypothetical protein
MSRTVKGWVVISIASIVFAGFSLFVIDRMKEDRATYINKIETNQIPEKAIDDHGYIYNVRTITYDGKTIICFVSGERMACPFPWFVE